MPCIWRQITFLEAYPWTPEQVLDADFGLSKHPRHDAP